MINPTLAPHDPIKILICEDQTLMREGLRTVLDLEPGLHVIGEAIDGAESITNALHLRPDIILMDIKMPKLTGVEATAAITTQQPDARIIILTTFDHDDYVFEALEAGAMGYLLKDVPATELIGIIKRVYAGEKFIQPMMAAVASTPVNLGILISIKMISGRRWKALVMLSAPSTASPITCRPGSKSSTVRKPSRIKV